jgi:hypothetical protein
VLKEWEGLPLSIIMEEVPFGELETGVAEDEAIVSDEFGVVIYMHFI